MREVVLPTGVYVAEFNDLREVSLRVITENDEEVFLGVHGQYHSVLNKRLAGVLIEYLQRWIDAGKPFEERRTTQ